eukprot:COSAG06_NODE_12850_length_1320_cov_18.769861_2_plen_244_part_01
MAFQSHHASAYAGTVGVIAAASAIGCCWAVPELLASAAEERAARAARAVLCDAAVQEAAADSLVRVLEHRSVHSGFVRLLQTVLADSRTARAGQQWIGATVNRLTPMPRSPRAGDSLGPSAAATESPPMPTSTPDSGASGADSRQPLSTPRFLHERGDAELAAMLADRGSGGAPADSERDDASASELESAAEISHRASEMIAEIMSSPAMERELQRLLRSTLRAPGVQEAAADAVGGIGRRTVA